MVDVPLSERTRARQPKTGERPPAGWGWSLAVVTLSVLAVIALGGLFHAAIEAYHARMTLTGLVDDPRPVALSIAGESLSIPANMIRLANTRRGGEVDRVDLVLHWPTLAGFSDELSQAFKDSLPSASIIYASITQRDTALDATARLDHVYQRFFVGKPIAAPAGLVGRRLNDDSGYGGEIVYFLPDGPRPFVARCPAESTAEVPPTCLRDVNLGRGLSLLYRFHQDLLGDWQALDTGIRTLAAGFLRPST